MLSFDKQEIQKLCGEDYQLGEMIGQGGFGVVFKGITDDKKAVALKCIDKNLIINQQKDQELRLLKDTLLLAQVEIMMNCQNQHIIKCLDLIQNQKIRIVVLEYCEGGDLYARITREQKIPENQSIHILAQIVYGFATLHKNNIIHRDFKSQNIFIRKGVYKIADFGAAKKLSSLTVTKKGVAIGSRITMAPEVMRGEEYGIQCDMWSLGVVYFEMLFGVLPFQKILIGDECIIKVHKFIRNQQCSEESKQFIRRALVINQNDRLKWVDLYRMYSQKRGLFAEELLDLRCIKIEEDEAQVNQMGFQCFDMSKWICSKQQEISQKKQIKSSRKVATKMNTSKVSKQKQKQVQSKALHSKLKNQSFTRKFEDMMMVRLRAELIHTIIDKFQILNQKLPLEVQINMRGYFIQVNYYARSVLFNDKIYKKYIKFSLQKINQQEDQELREQILLYQSTAKRLYRELCELIKKYEKCYNTKIQIQSKRNKSKKSVHKTKAAFDFQTIKNNFEYRYIVQNTPSTNIDSVMKAFNNLRRSFKKHQIIWNEEDIVELQFKFKWLIEDFKERKEDLKKFIIEKCKEFKIK